MREIVELLNAWNSFYVMIGSAAAALTGLMFVVITLVSDSRSGVSADGISTFSTPTVIHFSAALFTAAVMTAPFRSFVPIEIIVGLLGVSGAIHVVRVARRTWRLETYKPDAEDWSFFVLLPLLAYVTFALGAVGMVVKPSLALYAPAGAVTLLIFVGIHNAWDVVTFIATGKAKEMNEKAAAAGKPEGTL